MAQESMKPVILLYESGSKKTVAHVNNQLITMGIRVFMDDGDADNEENRKRLVICLSDD